MKWHQLLMIMTFAGNAEFALADETSVISKGMRELTRISADQPRDAACFPGQETADGQACSKLSDSFCKDLWDIDRGNKTVFDGKITLGNSPRSGLSQIQLTDMRALVESVPRLPADLRERGAITFGRLENALARENGSIEWKREISDIVRDFQRAQEDVATARLKENLPNGTKGAEERLQARRIQADLSDQVLSAKYSEHPNWKRVERVFPQAKEDLLKAIDTLPIAAERKAEMAEQVRTVKLSLPSSNPEGVNRTNDCGTTSKEAYYLPTVHSITLCAGLFNAFQSDTALTNYIMHEISHSVDPTNLSNLELQNNSPVARQLLRLKGAKGAPIKCDDWSQVQTSILKSPVPPPRHTDLEKLYSCLESRHGMIVWNARRVTDAAMTKAALDRAALSEQDGFSTLASPTVIKNGRSVPNEFFLKPDLWTMEKERRPSNSVSRPENVAEIFTQVASCLSAPRGDQQIPFGSTTLTPAERAPLFKQAMDITEKLLRRRAEEQFSYCGQNCPGLVKANAARNSNETFADWLANRASWRMLARIPDRENRREASALAWANFCDQEGVSREAPDLALAEKHADLEEHPDNRRRRLSIYDDISAGLLGCQFEPGEQQSFGSCEP